MGYENPSRFNNNARKYRTKRALNKNQKRANWVKKVAPRAKGARAQSKQITALAKTVDNLDSQLNPRTGKYTLAQGLAYTQTFRLGYTPNVTSPTQVFPLMPAQIASGNYPIWNRWGPGVSTGTNVVDATSFSTSEISTCQRAKVGTMKLELAFSAANEPSPIQVTVQVVTFANAEVAQYITDKYGVDLQSLPATDSTGAIATYGNSATFPAPSLGGALMLNPAYFRVIKEQRFVLANTTHTSVATAVTDSKDTYRSISWNVPMGNIINARDRGNWTRENAVQGYSLANRRFLFVTTDNFNTDLESPQMNIFASCIMYGQK